MAKHVIGLRELRLKRGLTQQQLAENVPGISRGRIAQYETGNLRIENMTLGTAMKICRALRVTNPARLIPTDDDDSTAEDDAEE